MRLFAAMILGMAMAGIAVTGEEPPKESPKIPLLNEKEKTQVTPEQQKAFEASNFSMYMHPGKATQPSQVLGDLMWEVMQTQYKETPAAEKIIPKGYTEEDLLKKLKERVPQLPCVQVTAEEEENFKAGKFQEIDNYTTYMDFGRILTQNKIPQPATIKLLERDKQKDGRLRGVHLELAVRLAFMSLSKLYLSAERTEKK